MTSDVARQKAVILKMADEVLNDLSRLNWDALTPAQRRWATKLRKLQEKTKRLVTWEVIENEDQ